MRAPESTEAPARSQRASDSRPATSEGRTPPASEVPFRRVRSPNVYRVILRKHCDLKASAKAVCFVASDRAAWENKGKREAGEGWRLALATIAEESGQGKTAARENRNKATAGGWLLPSDPECRGGDVYRHDLIVPESAWRALLDCPGRPEDAHRECARVQSAYAENPRLIGQVENDGPEPSQRLSWDPAVTAGFARQMTEEPPF